MLKLKNIILILTYTLSLTACANDRAGSSTSSELSDVGNVLGVLEEAYDSDDDGLSDEDEITIYFTNPDSNDTDGDGLSDGEEILTHDTNATNVDTDGDRILDYEEIYIYDTNASNTDTDNDGLSDGEEILTHDTNATNVDTDGDGILDYEEIYTYDTNASNTDTDNDGLSDGKEILTHDTNATNIDSDGDGILDYEEIYTYDTNASNIDTDNDGLSDAEEILTHDTNATNPDTDGDCLLDSFEILKYDTNATNPDSDGDGVSDGIEVYSYAGESNETCQSFPETLANGVNLTPAMDNIPNENDVINALDATNHTDSDGDGLSDAEEAFYGTSTTSRDSDGDGISDLDEIGAGTDPLNTDSDGDGLSDFDELKIHGTNATNADTDNDGLTDGEEINSYDTNASNPDTDGDCLLDSFEVLNYATNPNSKDSDSDTVEDGIEIYSYASIDNNCMMVPETLEQGFNENPAIDNLPSEGSDVINALDPNNDNDGDGQSNSYENNCTKGDPLDPKKLCEYFIDSEHSISMNELGYAYIPGGFDVDEDGIKEKGFWLSRYQARRKSDHLISSEEVMNIVKVVNQFISKTFKVVNRDVELLSYSESELDPISVLAGSELLFDEQAVTGYKRISKFTPYLAEVCMRKHALITQNGKVLDLNVSIPTHKQYLHVKKLLDADFRNGGDGRHIRNGLLGVDSSIPLFDYTVVIDEFGETKKEYVRNLVQLVTVKEGLSESIFNFEEDVPSWWEANSEKFKQGIGGSLSTQDLGFGIGLTKDPYAIIVRGGEVLDLRLGVSGADTDGESDSTGISFRAATPYFK